MAFAPAPAFTTRPTLRGDFGMTATTHWLATASGQAVLERGGNAFDAAVATAFVLHVVEPHLNGPGGDMTGIFATADAPEQPTVLMGQGPAPRGATIEHYTSLGLTNVPGAGALAAAVPGSVDAWLLLLESYGTWELADVLSYAIHYARDGHPIVGNVAATIERVSELFTEHWPSSAALWMPGGAVPQRGDIMTNPEYADVLEELIAAGEGSDSREQRVAAARRDWHTGRVAQAIADFNTQPHTHADGGTYAGVMTREDLAEDVARFEAPTTIEFRGYTIAKIGHWGQGPVLLQALKILDGFDDEHLDPSTELGAHTIIEALKLALADRDVHYGDGVGDLSWLLSDEYAAQRRSLITAEASHEFRPGTPPAGAEAAQPFRPTLVTLEEWEAAGPAGGANLGVGEPTVQKSDEAGAQDVGPGGTDTTAAGTGGGNSGGVEPGDGARDTSADGTHRGDTCHLDIVDHWGNMISATPSGGWLQSSPAVPGIGFNLGTRLQMTWLDEDSPSALRPGQRPRTTLSPTLISKDGQPIMALGTPGGDQQDQWQLLAVLRLLVGGYEPQQAIDAPALHTTAMPASFYPRVWEPAGAVVEDRLGPEVIEGLRARGHRVTEAGDWSLGRLSVVTRDPQTGQLSAAANPRGAQGYAAGR